MAYNNDTISQRVKLLMQEYGLSQSALARKAQYDQGALSKMLRREKAWSANAVEKVARALGVAPEYLTSAVSPETYSIIPFPIVAEWYEGGFDYQLTYRQDPLRLGLIVQSKGGRVTLKPIYGIEVKDDSLLPMIPRGSLIRVQRDTWEEIEEGNMVIYCKEDGYGSVRRVHFEGAFIHLISPNPNVPPVKVPKTYQVLLERVIGVDF